jgi:glycoprotein endo-alpha-1,2-mannosidase
VRVLLGVIGVCLLAPAAAGAAGDASIFYYPWWGTKVEDGKFLHWSQYGHAPPADLASTFYPARGPYSSAAPDVVRAQMADIRQAGVREVISSWWGWGSPEDERLPLVMRVAEKLGLDVAVQIEPYEKWLRTADVLDRDLGHLRDAGIHRVYVYRPFDGTIDDDSWQALIADHPDLEFYAQTLDVSRAAADGFDGVYTYDTFAIRGGVFAGLCARAHAAGIACAPSVGPGYNARRATGDGRIRSRRQGKTYDLMWRAAIAAHADRVTITSYNEWHEGTQIEPAKKHPPELFDSYQSYEGAYGKTGRAAERAYLVRTTYWTRAYRLAAMASVVLRTLADAFDDGR